RPQRRHAEPGRGPVRARTRGAGPGARCHATPVQSRVRRRAGEARAVASGEGRMSVRPVIMGELGLLSLFDLAQLLMLNGATGSLHVFSHGKKGLLRFERGQIANAIDERMHEGEDAACRVFGWRTGTFEFRVEPPTGGRT